MKTPKEPTALQLFKQWKKYNLAADKANYEKDLLSEMASKAPNVYRNRITADGFIYELSTTKGKFSWQANLDVTKLGSIEEFSKLIK